MVDVHNVDAATTALKYESNNLVLKGWRTPTGKRPYGKVSSLALTTHFGMAELDMARQIDYS